MANENQIGTLNEHSLHAYLKSYYQKDKSKCEIKVGSFVADILDGNKIIEIQTRGFSHLNKKLDYFLKDYNVTVVFPVEKIKTISWIDKETGETSKPHKSPKKGEFYDIFFELVYLKKYLENENLKFKIVLLNVDEYRYLNGWDKSRKRGSTRCDRVPSTIADELTLSSIKDYTYLLPKGLPEKFTSKDLMKAFKRSKSFTYRAISVLKLTGTINKVGKEGRSFLYSVSLNK